MAACRDVDAPTRLRDRRRLVRDRRREGAAHRADSTSTASTRPTASAATGCSTTPTGCRRRTARCTSTRRASAWSTPTSRCRSPIRTSRTTPTSPATSTTTSTTSASATGSRSGRGSSAPSAAPTASWSVQLDGGETRRYDALLVANGHHWDPRWPEPAFPGSDVFAGEQLHSHDYTGRGSGAVPRQARGRAGHGQLGHGHRRRGVVHRRVRASGGAAGRVGDPQVRLRAPARPDLARGRGSRSACARSRCRA